MEAGRRRHRSRRTRSPRINRACATPPPSTAATKEMMRPRVIHLHVISLVAVQNLEHSLLTPGVSGTL